VISLHVDPGQMARLKAGFATVSVRTVPTVLRTARKAVWQFVVEDVKKSIANDSGIGRSIWGGKSFWDGSERTIGLDKQGLVSQGRLLITQDGGQTSLVLRGIPALLEGGGPIKQHYIKRPFGNKDKGGKPLRQARPKMLHPGMQLRAHRFGRDTLRAAEGKIQGYVNDAVGEMLRRAGF
jgi:hypothetical protein